MNNVPGIELAVEVDGAQIPVSFCRFRDLNARSKGMRFNGRCSTQLLRFDPDSLHFVTTCSFPPGSFLGAIQRLFFDVRYARPSAVAQKHIGAACWLVTARLYNLKRPKSQFCSTTMRVFCMIGILE
jgi:hypothetical protein